MNRNTITLLLGLLIGLTLVATTLAGPCPCPKFNLVQDHEICPSHRCMVEDPTGPGLTFLPAACKMSAHTYYVLPNLSTHTYTWTVVGGTPTSTTGNPNVIVWGNGEFGNIMVVAEYGGCADTLRMRVCLTDPPDADFSFSPTSPCTGTPVNFSNLCSGGGSYLWDFGDGNTSTDVNPVHPYSAPGTYDVLLTVWSDCEPPRLGDEPGSSPDLPDTSTIDCMCCSDTITKQITVTSDVGPDIFPTVCEEVCGLGTMCPGDTASFCTSSSCTPLNWSVAGGSIVNNTGTCIDVVWNASYTAPTSVSLDCGSGCSTPTELYAPVFYPNLPMFAPSGAICMNSTETFAMPEMPGTFYSWSVTAPYPSCFAFEGEDSNTAEVGITFNCTGTFTITCNYENPLADCGPGSSSVTVDVKQAFQIYWGTNRVCVNGSGMYGSSGPATWTISPSAPITITGTPQNPTIDFTGVAPGIYVITATATTPSNFCNPSDNYQVEVIAPPVLNPILGDTTICPGEHYVYSITSNTTGYPFDWTVTGGTLASEMGAFSDSVVIVWDPAGPYNITVSQTIAPPGCKGDTTLTVTPFDPPVISSGSDTVCVDQTETYTATVANGNPGDYQWSITPAGHGTITFGQGTNTVSILWHAAPGGPAPVLTVTTCSGSDAMNIVVSDIPNVNISPNNTPIFCVDSVFTLTLVAVPGNMSLYTYQWYGPATVGSTTGDQVNIDISALSIGTYQYYVEMSQGGCTKTSNIVEVKIIDCGSTGGTGCSSSFIPYFDCTNNMSIVFIHPNGSYTGTYNWSISPGVPAATIATPSLSTPTDPGITITQSGTYTITLNPTGCSSSSETISVLLPDASISISPSPVCTGVPTNFTPSPAGSGFRYEWNFGDGAYSYLQGPSHAYGAAGTYTVTMVVWNDDGCVDTAETTITVFPSTPCSITASDTAICPGQTATLTAACPGAVSWQWFRNSGAISGATSSSLSVSNFGNYTVSITDGNGCITMSDPVYILLKKAPVAEITGEDNFCVDAGSSVDFSLSALYNPDYAYSWSAPWTTPGITGVSFTTATSPSPLVTITVSGSSTSDTALIVVEVTDTTTGCKAWDSLCVNINVKPQPGSPVTLCYDNQPHTISTPTNSAWTYLWNSGATTPSITATYPGDYSVTITDMSTGCTATQLMATILEKPDLDLFPRGCDSICVDSTYSLYIPLGLEDGWTYPGTYTSITWMDGTTDITPSSWAAGTLSFSSSSPGDHQLTVIVQDNNGCIDTSEVFCLYVVDCSAPAETTCVSCCDEFDISFETEIEGEGSNWTVTTSFNTGPNDLIEIRANLVNFYMNDQPGCNRCVGNNMGMGSIVSSQSLDWGSEEVDPTMTCEDIYDDDQSPREIVWNLPGGSSLVPRPSLSGESFAFDLIGPSSHPFQGVCCCDTTWFCVRWTFTDVACRTCDTLICYTAGDSCAGLPSYTTGDDPGCTCEITSIGIKDNELAPGGTFNMPGPGTVPLSLYGVCNPADCEPTFWWTVSTPAADIATLNGPTPTYNFTTPGVFQLQGCMSCGTDTCCQELTVIVPGEVGAECNCRIREMRIGDKPLANGESIGMSLNQTQQISFSFACAPAPHCESSGIWTVTKPGGATMTSPTPMNLTFDQTGTWTVQACVTCTATSTPWHDSECCQEFTVRVRRSTPLEDAAPLRE